MEAWRARVGEVSRRGQRAGSLTFARLSGIAKEHLRSGHVEHRVRDVGCEESEARRKFTSLGVPGPTRTRT